MTLGELVFVLSVFALSTVSGGRCRYIILNNVAQLDGRQRVFVLDATLDVDKTLAEGVVTLCGIGQEVLQDLAIITVLQKVYCISHLFRLSLLVYC